MVQPDSGTRATASGPSDLEKYSIHSGGGQPPIESSRLEDRRYWGHIKREWVTARPGKANRKKKAKRKQAQASRRKNRR